MYFPCLQVLFQNDSPATLLARVLGITGPIDQEMLVKGRDTYKYFTKNHMLYERNQVKFPLVFHSSFQFLFSGWSPVLPCLIFKRLIRRVTYNEQCFHVSTTWFIWRLCNMDPSFTLTYHPCPMSMPWHGCSIRIHAIIHRSR